MNSKNIITRSIHSRIQNRLFQDKAIILLGPRQSGKTTLIKALLEKAFVLVRLPAYSRNVRSEIKKGKSFEL